MAARAAASTLDDLGSAAILSDIAAMRHETLGVRLFVS
jgi:urease accessory protein